jgi:hypothetical protein
MFNYDDFRANEGIRAEFAQWLRSDMGMLVLRVMRDKYRPYDVPPTVDALASARSLSQFHGAHVALNDLEALATPPSIQQTPESEFEAPVSDHDRLPSPDELDRVLNQRHHDNA